MLSAIVRLKNESSFQKQEDVRFSTTPAFENRPIKEYKDVVISEPMMGVNTPKDLFADGENFIGGLSSPVLLIAGYSP